MTKGCNCKDWLENIGILNSAVMLYFTHNSKNGLKKSFLFCSYCGKKLVDVNE